MRRQLDRVDRDLERNDRQDVKAALSGERAAWERYAKFLRRLLR